MASQRETKRITPGRQRQGRAAPSVAAGSVSGSGTCGGGQGPERVCGSAAVRRALYDFAGVVPEVSGGWRGAVGAGWRSARDAAECGIELATRGHRGGEARAAERWQPSDPRRAEALLWTGDLGHHGAAGAQAGGTRIATTAGACQAATEAAALRTRRAQPVMAVGPVHVPAQEARAAVRGGIPGRSLALSGESGACASSAQHAGAGGALAWHRRVWCAARDPDRPRAPVHELAG